MSPENFQDKLRVRYLERGCPTPCQIQRGIEKGQKLTEISLATGIDNFFVLEKVFHPDGKYFINKMPKFKNSIQKIKDRGDGEALLNFLTPECVKKNGSINIKKLRQNFNKNGANQKDKN